MNSHDKRQVSLICNDCLKTKKKDPSMGWKNPVVHSFSYRKCFNGENTSRKEDARIGVTLLGPG